MFDRFIDYVAKVAPDKIAIRSFEGSITFAAMNRDINRLAHALLDVIDNSSEIVAVNYKQVHIHWMLLMALSRIGVASASVSSNSEIAEKEIAILQPDAIISDTLFDIDTAAKIHVLDLNWYDQAMKRFKPDPIYTLYEPDRIVRVSIAAGTSFMRHRIDYTASMIESSVIRMITQEKISWSLMSEIPRYPILLPTLAFGSFHGFLCYLSIWSIGGTIIMADREQYFAAIAMLSPDLMVISPAQLQLIAENLPEDIPRQDHLRLIVVAGNFPNGLRHFVQQRLTKNLNVTYATSEAGVIASINIDQINHDDTAGLIMPWIDVQVVDDQDHPLTYGEIGNIRIKSPNIVQKFFQNVQDTHKQFKNGWFYPGDLGILNEEGLLRLIGRVDELYNFGGDKFYANKIDAVICSIEGIKDAALFSMPDNDGIQQPWLAIVRGDNFDIDQIARILEKEFYNLPDVSVLWVNSIPRDEEGHVLRNHLEKLAMQYIETI